MSAAICGHARC